MSSGPRSPLSGMALSTPDSPEVDSAFDVPDAARYEDGGLLGEGGMGEVRAARDARLDREVALKVARDPSGEAAMIREAHLTARLDHPGVVVVHGAGRLPDGRAYYTMPVLRGRTLEAAIAEAPNLAARLRLVRNLVDACSAVAHAHEAGVLHRDLKPCNLLIGRHGETRVADWGLAAPLQPDGLTLADPPHGTPGFQSPEQAAGARLGPRSDVYSLGATLGVLLGEGAAEAPELAAIATRATRPLPEDRYPSATALADDLLAWFEGRRVSAHAYSSGELLRRLLRRWRGPIAGTAAALIVVATALTAAAVNVVRERNRALIAEEDATTASASAELSLARALVANARVAAAQGRRADAEILAANALKLAPSPAARGVLARFGVEARPARISASPLPSCQLIAVSRDGRRVACALGEHVELYAEGGEVVRLPGAVTGLAFAGDTGPLVLQGQGGALSAWQDGELRPQNTHVGSGLMFSGAAPGLAAVLLRGWVQIVGLGGGEGQVYLGCGPRRLVLQVWVESERQAVLACGDAQGEAATVILSAFDAPPELLTTLELADGTPTALAANETGQRLAVGTTQGVVLLLDRNTGAIRRLKTGDAPIDSLAWRGDLLAVAEARGDVGVWDLNTGLRLTFIPSGPATVSWLGDRRLRVVGAQIEDWQIPEEHAPGVLPQGEGVSAVAVSPDGQWVASALGNGEVLVLELATGAVVLRARLDTSVAKALAFSPDGAELAAGVAGTAPAMVLDVATGAPVRALPASRVRRLAWSSGSLVVASYGDQLQRFSEEDRSFSFGAPVQDLSAARGTDDVILLLDDGRILRLGPRGEPTQLGLAPNGVAVAAGAQRIAVLLPGGFQTLGGDLVEIGGARALSIALSPDERWIAVGQLDGQISLWSAADGALLATLSAHTQRAQTLAFTPSGEALISGSWDANVAVWDLRHLEQDTAALSGALEAAWGRSLADVLGR